MADSWQAQLGGLIRSQRQLAKLSLRELAALTKVSNPYLSQLERGLHQPSLKVVQAIADALNLSAETLLTQAGLLDTGTSAAQPNVTTEHAIRADRLLSTEQKDALLSVYHSYVAARSTQP